MHNLIEAIPVPKKGISELKLEDLQLPFSSANEFIDSSLVYHIYGGSPEGVVQRWKKLCGSKYKVIFARSDFEDAIQALNKQQIPPGGAVTQLSHVQKTDQRGAILNAWLEVERAIRHLVTRRRDVPANLYGNTYQALRTLPREIVSGDKLSLIHELRMLRNRAIHDPDFQATDQTVASYVRVASEAAEMLLKAARKHRRATRES